MEDVDSRIDRIRDEGEHGATLLTAEALEVLGAAAALYESGPRWRGQLEGAAQRLVEAKPAMVSIRNATRLLLRLLLALGPVEGRRRGRELAERLVRSLNADADAAAGHASRLLSDGATIVTCSRSSTVERCMRRSREERKRLSVLVVEEADAPGSPGAQLGEQLARMGVAVELVKMATIRGAADRARSAIVGADAITPAFVVNGTPTLALARACSGRAPLYAIGGSVKFGEDAATPPGYDKVPMRLVSGLVTENGVIMPEEVASYPHLNTKHPL